MTDRLQISTDCLRDIASTLYSLQDELDATSSRISYIDLHGGNGGNVPSFLRLHLSDGSSFSGTSISTGADALSKYALKLAANIKKIADSTLKAAERFERAEEEIACLFSETETEASVQSATSPYTQGKIRIPSKRPFTPSEIHLHMIKLLEEQHKRRQALKTEYEDILKTSDPSSNPRIYEIIDKRFADCNFTPEQRKLLIDKIQNAPSNFRDLFIYSFYKFELKNTSHGRYTGAYNPADNTLYCDTTNIVDDESLIDIFFHEAGHAIDATNNRLSRTDELLEKLESDTKNFIIPKIAIYGDELTSEQKERVLQAFMSGTSSETSFSAFWGNPQPHAPEHLSSAEKKVYDKVVKHCYAVLKATSYENDCMPHDILTGMTNNTISSNGGHRKDYAGDYYWFNPNGQRTGAERSEAWAEYYSSMMTGDATSQAANTRYMKESTECMAKIAENAAKNLRT